MRFWITAFLIVFLALAGCLQTAPEEDSSSDALETVSDEARAKIEESLVIKSFLQKNPSAQLDIQVLKGSDFSSEQKELFLDACNKKWRDELDYFVVQSSWDQEELVAWLLPTETGVKTDCFSWSGEQAGSSAVAQILLEINEIETSEITDSSAVLSWGTSVPSTGTVEYGLNPDSMQETLDRNELSENHSVSFSGLVSGTKYYYRIKAKSSDNQQKSSPVKSFETTGVPPSEIEFVISDIRVSNIASTTATVFWKTSLPALSTISYSDSRDTLDKQAEETTETKEHSLELTNLSPLTPVYFKIESAYSDGRIAQSGIQSFVTLGTPDFLIDTSVSLPSLRFNETKPKKLMQMNYAFKVNNQSFEGIVPMHFELKTSSGETFCSSDFNHSSTTVSLQFSSAIFTSVSDCYNKPVPSGTYSFSLAIDPNRELVETNYQNNRFSTSLTVTTG